MYKLILDRMYLPSYVIVFTGPVDGETSHVDKLCRRSLMSTSFGHAIAEWGETLLFHLIPIPSHDSHPMSIASMFSWQLYTGIAAYYSHQAYGSDSRHDFTIMR